MAYQEGQTATNPQTGERVIFSNGGWQPVGGAEASTRQPPRADPAPSTSQPPAFIPGVVKPEKPQQPNPGVGYTMNPDGTAAYIPGGSADPSVDPDRVAKAAKVTDSQVSAVRELRGVLDKINQVDEQARGGWFDTGRPGAFVRALPDFVSAGSDAYDLSKNITTIDAAAAFNALAEMRANSPTGGALGNVTEKELDLLKASVANLDPNQSEGQFLKNLDEARSRYINMLRRLDPAAADEFANKGGSASDPAAPPGGRDGMFDENGQPISDAYSGMAYGSNGEPLGLVDTVSDDGPAESRSTPASDNAPYSMSNIARGLGQGAGSIVEAGGEFLGLLANPIGSVIGRAAGYEGYTADLGTTLREALSLPDNPNAISDTIIKGGTGALTGSLAARGASVLTNPGTWQNALAQFGATPVRDALAGAGAGLGGEVGRELGGVPGQVVGTLAGGVGGYFSGNALARFASPRTASPVMQAADDLGVTMLPADVGGVGTRMATGAVGRTLGGIPIAEGAERSINSAATARTRIAGEFGAPTDNVRAGQAVKRGFKQFENGSLARAEDLYGRVSVPADTQVQLGQTRGALAEVTRGMQSNPELSRLWANHPRLRATLEALTPKDVAAGGRQAFMDASERLSGLHQQYEQMSNAVTDPKRLLDLRNQIAAARQDLTAAKGLVDTPPQGGELSWEDMKRFRSIVGEVIGQPGIQRDGSDIAGLRKLYGALSADMEVTAARAGPKALQEFRRANQYWRGRESRIDDVFSVLLGKDGGRSDEAVFKQINSWAQGDSGDFSRIARTIRSMPDDEANTVRATLIQRMGMAKPAGQDATGEVFQPALFSTQWRGLSKRAKAVLFPNTQHRQDLDKLAEITDGMKRATAYQNFSNTALSVNAAGQGALALTNPPLATALAGLQFAGGKLLASPRFARIIASTSKLPARVQGRKLKEQLSILATREPMLASDVEALQEHLQNTAAQ